MKKENYHLKNWKEQLEEDWEYLRQDNGTANIESIIEKLFQDIRENFVSTTTIGQNTIDVWDILMGIKK